MIPTLSQAEAYSTDHLLDAADHWDGLADHWEDAHWQVRNQAHALDWQGLAGDALRSRTASDYIVAADHADLLRKAARIARQQAGELQRLRNRVLYAVEDARNAGFTVGEDLSVTDTRTSRTTAELAARQAQAQVLAADIRSRASALIGADTKVARDLTSAAAGIGGNTFHVGGAGQNGSVQLAGYGLKRDGGDNTLKVPERPNPPTVINMHAGENPPPIPGRHQCDGWDITKDTGEAIGGPLLITGSILGGIAAAPLGPPEWAMAIGGVLTGGATTIDGFKGLEGCD
jgi:hypothetical protein